jgi:hypothetical protein
MPEPKSNTVSGLKSLSLFAICGVQKSLVLKFLKGRILVWVLPELGKEGVGEGSTTFTFKIEGRGE